MKILCLVHSVLRKIQECIAVTLPITTQSSLGKMVMGRRIRRMIGELNATSLSRKYPPSHVVVVAAVLRRAITLELDDDQTLHATSHNACVDTSGLVEMLQRH